MSQPPPAEVPVTFPCGPLTLEGHASTPAAASHAVVLCHPHPEYGGTMDDGVVTLLARGLGDAGVATLRFNFRGVGASQGRHGGGAAEVDDVRAALDWLAAAVPSARLALAGYSFGAAVALMAGAVDLRPARQVAVALPAAMLDPAFLADCRTPTLFVQGDRDDLCPRARLEELLTACPAETRAVHLAGADHFLRGAGARLRDAVLDFVVAD